MQKRRTLARTALAAVALCWAICGSAPTADAVPAPATGSAAVATCAPQTQPGTVSVAGSDVSPEQKHPQPKPTEAPTTQPPAEEEPPAQGGMLYVPRFGYLKSEGPGEWSVSENVYENGNKVGIMG